MAAVQNNVIILNETDPRFSVSTVLVAAGGVATIQAGTPTKSADATGASTGAVVPMVDADGTTAQRFTGISKNTSSDTASVAGSVNLWIPLPGYVYGCKAKTASLANTAALVQALMWKRVIWDLAASLWSVDTAAADAAANMLVIVGGDYQTQMLYFTYKYTGSAIGQIA